MIYFEFMIYLHFSVALPTKEGPRAEVATNFCYEVRRRELRRDREGRSTDRWEGG